MLLKINKMLMKSQKNLDENQANVNGFLVNVSEKSHKSQGKTANFDENQ